jgi:hypothetical protein
MQIFMKNGRSDNSLFYIEKGARMFRNFFLGIPFSAKRFFKEDFRQNDAYNENEYDQVYMYANFHEDRTLR